MNIKSCLRCDRRKTIRVPGGMTKKCNVCDGVGYIEDITINEDDGDIEKKLVSKRGRPRKEIIQDASQIS